MNHTLKEELVEVFRKNGADLVRFGNVERFEDQAVREIFPGTKTVIGAAFRVLRGARRGIEEGSTYYQYTTNGVETMEETIMPMALLRACAVLEDHGFEALPQRRNQTIMEEENSTNPEVDFNDIYRGKTAEKQLDFEACAVLCGLGERGLSGTLLTDDFGPFQRYVFVLTDAEIEPDPIVEPHLCDHCGECVKACPGHALSQEGKLLAAWIGKPADYKLLSIFFANSISICIYPACLLQNLFCSIRIITFCCKILSSKRESIRKCSHSRISISIKQNRYKAVFINSHRNCFSDC